MTTSNKRLYRMLTAAIFLLSIPLIAMQFTKEVKWTAMDFVVAGALLFSSCFAIELVLRKITKPGCRIAITAAILLLLLMIWLELAVGIFGTAFSGH